MFSHVCDRLFAFQMINVFLVTTVAGSLFDVLNKIANHPSDSFTLLGETLPKVCSRYVFVGMVTCARLYFLLCSMLEHCASAAARLLSQIRSQLFVGLSVFLIFAMHVDIICDFLRWLVSSATTSSSEP
jgi:Calcium-dependent channel, 7TM region, putative phosphate